MIQNSYIKTELIESHSPEEVTERLNELLKEYRNCNITYSRGFDASVGHYVAVEWKEEKIIPESLRDEFYLKGELHYCGECPYYITSRDKRVKYNHCQKGCHVWFEKEACEEFYKELKDGELELVRR